MIKMRQLNQLEMKEAIALRILCWTEELAGKAENTLTLPDELKSWMEWMSTADENNDIRLLIGAFEDDTMLGVAFASFAEVDDIPTKGIELNGLWVYPGHRNKGISLMLLYDIVNFFQSKGMENMVIYNHHEAPSNQYYRKLGANVIRQDRQMKGALAVDVFMMELSRLKEAITTKLNSYQNHFVSLK